MDFQIAAILIQEGFITGAIYALLALALVLVFSVTRVLFLPQGEFVAYGALTLAAIQAGHAPKTTLLLLAMGVLTFLLEAANARRPVARNLAIAAGKYLVFPLAIHLIVQSTSATVLPLAAQIALTMLIIVPMGPMVYRIAYQRLAESSTLLLLIVSIGVHFMLLGLGLVLFGAEGSRTKAFSNLNLDFGVLSVSGQSLWVIGICGILMLALYLYFGRSVSGKALRAVAINRNGARLVGIDNIEAGKMVFALAAALGALCGILISPITAVYYDSGFLIGLKAFVAAMMGGVVSYPAAALGAILVGMLEAQSSFWASALKEVIVFTLLIPVLLWRSLSHKNVVED
jgi:branched-chain amino acid transport system permease protein